MPWVLVQELGVLAAPAENLGSAPNTAQQLTLPSAPGLEDLMPSFGLCGLSICVVQIHMQAEHHTHENKIK